MMRSLWTGASGMVAQQLNIDVISNNLANVNTTGFKKSRAEFEDLMYQNMKIAGSITEGDNTLPVGIQVGMGVRPTAVHKFFTQGDFQNTGNALDVAIEGDGFFQVDVNGELMYTRAGSFKLNQDGTVVTANGYILQPEFAVPAETKNISISASGHIAALDAEGQEIAAAEIPLYTFINPAGLDARGRNLYTPTVTKRAYCVYCMRERLEHLFGGDLTGAVRALASESRCSRTQLEQAARLLEEYSAQADEFDGYDF